jgi:hypothetical protein
MLAHFFEIKVQLAASLARLLASSKVNFWKTKIEQNEKYFNFTLDESSPPYLMFFHSSS